MVATRSSSRAPGRSAEPRSTTVAGPRASSSCSAPSRAPASSPVPAAQAEAGRAAGQPDHGPVRLRRRGREGLRELPDRQGCAVRRRDA